MDKVAVLGATGTLGKAIVDELFIQDVDIKILLRDENKHKNLYVHGNYPAGIEVVYGDMDTNISLANTLEGVDTIFACFNTEHQYWKDDMPRWISRISDLAAALEARIVFPGNIYNFGMTKTTMISETDIQDTHTVKGQLRIALEKRLMRASLEGAKLTIIRLPDLYGPASFNTKLSNVFMTAILKKKANWFGNPHIMKEFMYTKDAAIGLINAAKNDNTIDQVIHYPGNQMTSHEFINQIYDVSRDVELSFDTNYSITPKYQIILKSIINKDMAELKELLYLYNHPMTMDGKKFELLIGKIGLTPHDLGIQQTLEWYHKWYQV